MKYIKITLLFFLLCFAGGQVNAQELTEGQKKIMQERVKQKVEEFTSCLSKVVCDTFTHRVRRENVNLLLGLFLGEGNPYDYYDTELGRDIHSTGVKMQTSSINSTYKSWQKLKRYIHRLYNPETGKTELRYTDITIESADAVRVDNIERVGDHYECVAYFCQRFIGYKDGRVVYGDITTKKVKCRITHIGTDDGYDIWDAKLGDIYVTSTESIW